VEGPEEDLTADHDTSSIEEYLRELSWSGVDLTHPLPVEQYLYFPLHALAQGVAEDLRREGFEVEVEQEGERPGWIAYVTRRIEPTVAGIAHVRGRVGTLAVARGGEYEGWNLVLFADEPAPDLDGEG
jgi:hypothetical protein